MESVKISPKKCKIAMALAGHHTDGSLQVSKKLSGLVNVRDFEQCEHIQIIVLASCCRLPAFKSPSSHEKSIFLKIRSFFLLQIFSGPQLMN